MNRTVAENIYAACESALAELTRLEHAIRCVEDEAERRDLMKSLSFVIADVLGNIRAPVVHQFPDIPPAEEPGEPDDLLDEEEQRLVEALSASDLNTIDEVLLGECAHSWRKVARIVMGTMKALDVKFPDMPPALYVRRIATLVQAGQLVSQGNLSYMRFSQVMLSSADRS